MENLAQPQKSSNQESINWKNILIGIVIGAIIVGSGIWVFLLLQPKPTTTSPSMDETTNWKTYTNETYKYSVRYPKDWSVGSVAEKGPSDEDIRFYTRIVKNKGEYTNEAYLDIIIEPNPSKQIPTREWYLERLENIPIGIQLEKLKTEEVTFRGLDALRINNQELFFAKDTNMFRIGWWNMGDQEFQTFSKKTFDQILSTFKFLD